MVKDTPFEDSDNEQLDFGEKEGHIGQRAIINNQIGPAHNNKQTNVVQYKDSTFKYRVQKDDPHYQDLQNLIQANGKETDQDEISK